ncbi:lipid A biosynthesis lauroyl acyltransferase [Sphaerisporangium melleum]|uniref:Lipid A biosynthesis lauroyl acyltransferase n=1 Tax=Sphaerisporangium melleum TaxID=321316 RepID=A0A917R441_9ACTN|nr:phosphatidylinositol mannoside acyltransferase [Sphaerisporangium melleum]GGK87263.1 lipid A biosynthesis lauroyl acyltransferase [Sphaerisporangium melleum]GII72381.1 lipid A biosynthesis lauroyl acyltransferase [Sphaerisporangium melleum]
MILALTDRLVVWALHAGWVLVPKLPGPVAAWLFRLVADVLWWRHGKPVRRLESNLARVTGKDAADPSIRDLSRAGMRSYFRYWMEALRLPAIGKERILSGTHVVHGERIFQVLDSGRGIVLALPHMGNWDLAGAWLIHNGHTFTTVMERLKPESLYERFVAFRESLGMEVLPLTAKGGGTAHAFGTLAQRLRAGRAVCLPAERDLTERGIEVDFFDGRTRMVAGPALLALQTGAALHPATLWFEGDDWGLHIHEEIPVPAEGGRQEKVAVMTQAMARVFQEGISQHPEDWHMLQRLWLDDLEPR